jgi:hypothetical protein
MKSLRMLSKSLKDAQSLSAQNELDASGTAFFSSPCHKADAVSDDDLNNGGDVGATGCSTVIRLRFTGDIWGDDQVSDSC